MPKRFVVAASRFSELPRFPAGVDLAEALTAAARQLHETPTPDHTLDTAVRLAVDLMPGAEYAGISLIERTARRRPLAWTGELVRDIEARRPAGERGPYWDRLWTDPVAEPAEGEGEEAESALAEHGLRSALSLRLRADRRRLTVLTVYARKPRAFDEVTRRVGRLFTAHVGIALDSATVREQLTEAMHTRDLIGQATGILMERMTIDAAGAFDSLVRASQRENVKLRDLARRIVDAHNTPDAR
ncbi:ANTAR domain-containing protein [Streptomyces sp. 15-116A]|uniref:ANTAR domain-containing protein n=1 Tax=Streptomyces sp. 15-116A TaxID=2259035 RepID=UPI0021B2032D|nr:ANTAR domain-containing protein [Streptomyces sp. 15-116A]MCT7353859.1 ANTAR domain-containing protein [Streptomyces sp. 15-116A]